MRVVPDYVWAVLTVWGEARGESDEGKVAVASVIRNRMQHRYSSDGTAADTVLRPFQFSFWNTDSRARIQAAKLDDKDPAWDECAQAWANAVPDVGIVKNAVLYYNPSLVPTPPSWAKPEKLVATIGAHQFYAG